MIVGLIIGTIGGGMLDFASHQYHWSRRRLWYAWPALPLIVLMYPLIPSFFRSCTRVNEA